MVYTSPQLIQIISCSPFINTTCYFPNVYLNSSHIISCLCCEDQQRLQIYLITKMSNYSFHACMVFKSLTIKHVYVHISYVQYSILACVHTLNVLKALWY